jgi:hypothetical protein
MILALALLALTPGASSLAGFYQSQTMEVGGGIELRADGHFRYELEYGAVDEAGEGDWTFDGVAVRLTSSPMPREPVFELVGDDPAPTGEVSLLIDKEGFNWSGRIDAIGTDRSGEEGLVSTDRDGKVDSGGHVLTSIDPLVPVYGTRAGHFPLSPDRGHKLHLKFHANDLGHPAFKSEPVALSGDALVMTRFDTEIRFVRVKP